MDRIGIYLLTFLFFLSFPSCGFSFNRRKKAYGLFWFLPNKAFQVGACLLVKDRYFASYIINHDAFTQSQLNGTTYLDKD